MSQSRDHLKTNNRSDVAQWRGVRPREIAATHSLQKTARHFTPPVQPLPPRVICSASWCDTKSLRRCCGAAYVTQCVTKCDINSHHSTFPPRKILMDFSPDSRRIRLQHKIINNSRCRHWFKEIVTLELEQVEKVVFWSWAHHLPIKMYFKPAVKWVFNCWHLLDYCHCICYRKHLSKSSSAWQVTKSFAMMSYRKVRNWKAPKFEAPIRALNVFDTIFYEELGW